MVIKMRAIVKLKKMFESLYKNLPLPACHDKQKDACRNDDQAWDVDESRNGTAAENDGQGGDDDKRKKTQEAHLVPPLVILAFLLKLSPKLYFTEPSQRIIINYASKKFY